MHEAQGTTDREFERQKWADEIRLRRRELVIKEQEQSVRATEMRLREIEARRSTWTNPLVLAIFAAAVAAFGNAIVAFINGNEQRAAEETRSVAQLRVEQAKGEAALILEAIKTTDPDKAAINLRFLVDSGLIADKTRRTELSNYLTTLKPGEGPALPGATPAPGTLASSFQFTCATADTLKLSDLKSTLEKRLAVLHPDITLNEAGEIHINVEVDRATKLHYVIWRKSTGQGLAIRAEYSFPIPMPQTILPSMHSALRKDMEKTLNLKEGECSVEKG